MYRDERLKIFILMLLIFFTGFMLRVETAHLPGLNPEERAYLTDENGLPYMYELDSYYNYRVTMNYLKNGHPGDTIRNGIPWDLHSYYPPGRPAVYPPLIAWISVSLYRFLTIFTDITLYELCFWLPALIAPFAGIAMFFLIRRYSGDLAGFIGGILTVTSPLYFARTVPGFFDTDMFNCLLPVLAVFFFAEAVESDDLRVIPFGVLYAISILIFSFTWTGWPFIFYVTGASAIIYCLIFWRRVSLKKIVFPLLIAVILVGLFNWGQLLYALNPLNLQSPVASAGPWPDIYKSVSELEHPSPEVFVSAAGPLNLGFGVLGVLVIISIFLRDEMRRRHLKSFTPFIFILSIVWMLSTLAAYYMSIRFGILAIPPLTFLSGVFLGVFFSYMNSAADNIPLRARYFTVLLISILIISVAVFEASEISRLPFINDDFADAMEFLSDETTPGTVVVTEWSYGHYITAAANRPVLFDGGSQNTPRAYWVFRAFETDNESLSEGILTMLTSSGDIAVSLLEKRTGDTELTVRILNDILGVDRSSAARILSDKYGMGEEFSGKLLRYTHPGRGKFTVLTTDGMKYIGYWYLYYGSWNFASGNSRALYVVKDVRKSDIEGALRSGLWMGKKPFRFIIRDGDSIRRIEVNGSGNFSVIFLRDDNLAVVTDRYHDESMFVRMVLLGEDTEHYRKIYRDGSVTVWGVI